MALRYFLPCAIAALLCGFAAMAQSDYSVKITNLGKKTGKLYVGWYNEAGSFMKPQKTVFARVVPVAEKSEVVVVFDKIPAGKYAISVFLDENGNENLDTNLIGMPREKYGFSNNVLPAMRAATYEEAAFEVKNAPGSLSIKLK